MLDVVRHIIINDSGITGLISPESVVAQLRDQGGALPCIMLQKDGVDTSDSKSQTSGIDDHTVYVHVFAESWDEANTLQRAVRSVIDGYSGNVTIGEIEYAVEAIRFVTDNDDWYDANEGVSTIVCQYSVKEKRNASTIAANSPNVYHISRVMSSAQWDDVADSYIPMRGLQVFKDTGTGELWPWVIGDGESVLSALAVYTSSGGPGGGPIAISDVTGLQSALNAKAALSHTHSISDVSGLQSALDGKSNTGHTHSMSDVSGLSAALSAKADAVHSHSISDVAGLQSELDAKQASLGFIPENAANKGQSNGYASLDSTGKVPSAQLPGFVDDVLEFANLASFPGTGETGKMYTDLATNKIYRWSGSVYVEISASPGSTDVVAEGNTNLYFTAARVLAVVLSGLSTVTATAVLSTDTILDAIGKLQAQINAFSSTFLSRSNNLSDLSNASTALNNLGATTVGKAVLRLSNPGAISFMRMNADNTVSALDAATFRSAIGAPAQDTISFITVPAANVPASTTTYAPISGSVAYSTTESQRYAAFGISGGFVSTVVVTSTTQTGTGSLVITLRVNVADTALVVTIAAGSAANVFSATGSVSYTANQVTSLKLQNNGTSTSASVVSISTLLRAA